LHLSYDLALIAMTLQHVSVLAPTDVSSFILHATVTISAEQRYVFDPRPVYVGFMADDVALGQDFL
jgi:hypothetical protein